MFNKPFFIVNKELNTMEYTTYNSMIVGKEIEETDNPEEREKYWIEYYGSFKNGYNATVGGDGKPYIDYDLVVATYRELKN